MRYDVEPRIVKAAEMRNAGLHATEIAERMGIALSTANGYIHVAIQAGLCKRMTERGENTSYRRAARIFKKVRGGRSASEALTIVAKEMGVSRKAASSLLSEARRHNVLEKSKTKLSGEASDLNRVIDDETAVWVRSQRIDGMTDMEMVAVLLKDMRLDAEGGSA